MGAWISDGSSPWRTTSIDYHRQITELESEIRRHHADFKRVSDLCHSGLDGPDSVDPVDPLVPELRSILRQIANIVG